MKYGLYIHIPFCKKKCKYCSFYSIPFDSNLIDKYLDSILKETKLQNISHHKFDSIYIGGGTPSIIDSKKICRTIELIKTQLNINSIKEFTVEINPATVNKQKISDYKSIGINRISVGIQSLNDNELSFLGRIHNSKDAIDSINLLHDNGIDNISVDLIYGIPNQTIKSFNHTLKVIVSLPVKHISAYSLSYDEGTSLTDMLNNGKLIPLSESYESKMYKMIQEYLESNKFEQYEISSFSLKAYKSYHNLKYWKRKSYIGIGASAFSSDYADNLRWSNYPDVAKYVESLNQNKLPVLMTENLTTESSITEHIMLSLRLTDGLKLNEFRKLFGFDIEKNISLNLIHKGYINIDKEKISIPKKYMFISNAIINEIISKTKLA